MLLQQVKALLSGRHTNGLSPLDVVNWVESKIELSMDGKIALANEPRHPKDGKVFATVLKILSAQPAIFQHDIMDRFWQQGKLILVTRDFKTYEESTIRVYPSRCSFCSHAASTPRELRFQRLAGACLPCTNVRGTSWFSPLWAAQRGIVSFERRAWYDPVSGILKHLPNATLQDDLYKARAAVPVR